MQLIHEVPQDIRARIDQRLEPLGVCQATWMVLLRLLKLEGKSLVQIELAGSAPGLDSGAVSVNPERVVANQHRE